MAGWDEALWRVRKHPATGTGRSASPWWVRGLHELVLLEAGMGGGGTSCLRALHAHKYSPAKEFSPRHQRNANRKGLWSGQRCASSFLISLIIAPQQAGQKRHAAPSTGRLRGEGWVSGASEGPVGEHLGSKTQDAPTASPAGGCPCPRDAGHGPKEGNGLTARDSQRPSSRPVGFAQHEGLTFPCPWPDGRATPSLHVRPRQKPPCILTS